MKLKYTHPAASNYNIKRIYELEDLQKELDMKMIKILFTPIDGDSFKDLEKSKRKVRKQENIREIVDEGLE